MSLTAEQQNELVKLTTAERIVFFLNNKGLICPKTLKELFESGRICRDEMEYEFPVIASVNKDLRVRKGVTVFEERINGKWKIVNWID
jgi:hypothetical protein